MEEFVIKWIRVKVTTKNVVPIITWIPWNPVITKNVVPKTESETQNGAFMYSTACRIVNTPPSKTVLTIDILKFLNFSFIISWWAHVIEIPEERSRMVLSNGILIGSKTSIVLGGQIWPISMFGAILLWKKDQKKEIKKNTSEVIKRTIPVFKPFATFLGCSPKSEDSR